MKQNVYVWQTNEQLVLIKQINEHLYFLSKMLLSKVSKFN